MILVGKNTAVSLANVSQSRNQDHSSVQASVSQDSPFLHSDKDHLNVLIRFWETRPGLCSLTADRLYIVRKLLDSEAWLVVNHCLTCLHEL